MERLEQRGFSLVWEDGVRIKGQHPLDTMAELGWHLGGLGRRGFTNR